MRDLLEFTGQSFQVFAEGVYITLSGAWCVLFCLCMFPLVVLLNFKPRWEVILKRLVIYLMLVALLFPFGLIRRGLRNHHGQRLVHRGC